MYFECLLFIQSLSAAIYYIYEHVLFYCLILPSEDFFIYFIYISVKGKPPVQQCKRELSLYNIYLN